MWGYTLFVSILILAGCAREASPPARGDATSAKPLLTVTPPAALPVPDRITPKSDTDWPARVNNKEIEVIQVINILNPVAAYIKEGFKQYGGRFSPQLQEEWQDTQDQLTKALSLYESCKGRKASGQFDRKLFLDMEETWQLLVKTGAAGVRTKTMVDDEIGKLTGA